MRIFFSQKRSRVSRTTPPRNASGGSTGLLSLRYQRARLVRIVIGLLGAIVIVAALQSWNYPFSHRIGDRFPDGLSARMTFRVVNAFETSRASRDREREVPFIFRNDSTELMRLPERLKAALGAVSEAESLDDLSEEVRRAFGLMPVPPVESVAPATAETSEKKDDAAFRFQQLKQAITPLDGSQFDTHISTIVDEFDRLIEPLHKKGLVNPVVLERSDLGLDSQLAIVDKQTDLPEHNPLADEQLWISVRIIDVTLSDLLNDAGYLSQRWSDFPTLETIRRPLETWLRNQARPTLEYDQSATQVARRWAGKQVEPVYDVINEGDVFLPPDGVIDQNLLGVLRAEYDASLELFPWEAQLTRVVIVFSLICMFFVLIAWYLLRYEPLVIESWPRLALYLVVVAVAAFLGRLTSLDPVRGEVAIVVATTMVMAVAYNQRFALLTAFMLSLLVCMSTRIDMAQFTVMLAASTAAVTKLKRVQSRQTIIIAGFLAGAVAFAVSWGTEVLLYPSPTVYYWSDWTLLQVCLKYAGWCVLAGFILSGSLPFIESTFGVVTGISLLEMSDSSHPLLQELFRKAPGTYNHSIAVATIAETAAKQIGADGLLVRVGAYFHDIGKIPKAEYFIENRPSGGANRHETLAPTMSTLIIIGHVKDGVDLAEEYHLPRALIDFIEQHHGTTLVEFFYHAANKKADAEPERKLDVEEAAFRYPGPKPQTKEAGVLMLSDCVESASRTLSEPTPARIAHLVHSLTMKRLLDGQFEECNLTLSEIHLIEESLIKSLISIHHGRIAYPDQQQREQKSA